MSRVLAPLLFLVPTLAAAQDAPVPPPVPPTGHPWPAPRIVYPTVYAATSEKTASVETVSATNEPSEIDRILEENPTLVPELLRLAAANDGQEELHLLLYPLGPKVVEPLTAALEEPELRKTAVMGLMLACVHDETPRSGVVKALLAVEGLEDEERLGLLAHVLLMTNPGHRAAYRRVITSELGEILND